MSAMEIGHLGIYDLITGKTLLSTKNKFGRYTTFHDSLDTSMYNNF